MSIEFQNETVDYYGTNPIVYDIIWEGKTNELNKAILKTRFLPKHTELSKWIKIGNMDKYNFIYLPRINNKILAVCCSTEDNCLYLNKNSNGNIFNQI